MTPVLTKHDQDKYSPTVLQWQAYCLSACVKPALRHKPGTNMATTIVCALMMVPAARCRHSDKWRPTLEEVSRILLGRCTPTLLSSEATFGNGLSKCQMVARQRNNRTKSCYLAIWRLIHRWCDRCCSLTFDSSPDTAIGITPNRRLGLNYKIKQWSDFVEIRQHYFSSRRVLFSNTQT